MSKNNTLFDDNNDSDEEIDFTPNQDYEKKYNDRKRKEEYLKLKNKYGEGSGSSESSSSEDEEEVVFSEKFEKEFFKTLSCLKNKDPRIYDSKIRFFSEGSAIAPKSTQKDDKPLKIRDYNRKIMTEKDGKYSDDEEEEKSEEIDRSRSPTYAEEAEMIKRALAEVATWDSDEEEPEKSTNIAGMFSKRQLTKEEEEAEEKSYREWLSGEIKHLRDNSDENDLKPLKEFWANPSLEEEEAFLRDYLLNQKFREPTSKKKIPAYESIVESDHELSEDERMIEEQAQFEENFNYRFEEPDQDFIKRYPRTLEHSMRKKDNKRAEKRAEVKERKLEEKKKKKEEINQMKSLKLKEIQEKILKLKEITGNDELAFNDEDIEGDFDPDAHDRRMKEIFDEEYYGQDFDAAKPQCHELDEELEIDDWDNWENQNSTSKNHKESHCEDDDFNMDCDYDPKTAKNKSLLAELQENSEGKRKRRKKKNKLAEALARKKPLFDPTKDASFSHYLDEYYKLDCEDVIGDLPCRFKYRQVPPTDYGLTTAEILMADDKELNTWYPLKKALQYRPEHRDINDQNVYSAKGRNFELKKKILPSLFSTPSDEQPDNGNDQDEQPTTSKKKKRRNKKKKSQATETTNGDAQTTEVNAPAEPEVKVETEGKQNKKKNKRKSEEPAESLENKPKGKGFVVEDVSTEMKKKRKLDEPSDSTENKPKRKGFVVEDVSTEMKKKKKLDEPSDSSENKPKKKFKHQKQQQDSKPSDPMSNISDERLKAYGLNPKKYRGFMKYKKY